MLAICWWWRWPPLTCSLDGSEISPIAEMLGWDHDVFDIVNANGDTVHLGSFNTCWGLMLLVVCITLCVRI